MRTLCFLLPLIAWADSTPALVYSSYLRSGFIPTAISADAAGNVYLAGNLTLDSKTGRTGVLIEKLDAAANLIYARTVNGSFGDSAAGIKADSDGNVYVVGSTNSPDFPASAVLATPPRGSSDQRSFILKLDLQGQIEFASLLGGGAASSAQAVELSSDGGIIVSGTAGAGFPSTPGAYSVPDTQNRPYLLKLDPTGTWIQFSATGIGGSRLALDVGGNIYMAGSTLLLDYPTTPGAFQPKFKPVYVYIPCGGGGSCGFAYPPGVNQYVTKVDAEATRLLYSTAVSNPETPPLRSFPWQVVNNGLAVDADGSAYLTGTAWGEYPYTVLPPPVYSLTTFLTKLDPSGAKVIYSIPLGGAGVLAGPGGAIYVGGAYNAFNQADSKGDPFLSGGPLVTQAPPAGLPTLPPGCRPNNSTIGSESYVSRVDAATGEVLSTQLIDAANLVTKGIALSGSGVWIAGAAALSSVHFTPGGLDRDAAEQGASGAPPGAYLGLVDFASSAQPAQTPRLDCVIDGANASIVYSVAPRQILTLSGFGLGPSTGAVPSGDPIDSLEGVSVTFDDVAGKLLYVSSAQVNVVVPDQVAGRRKSVLKISYNGLTSAEREYLVAEWAPNLFADLWSIESNCPICFRLVARNEDGQFNSKTNPARQGSVVTVYLNGAGSDPVMIGATVSDFPAEVVSASAENGFVTKVNVRIPALLDAYRTPAQSPPLVGVGLSLRLTKADAAVTAGPIAVAYVFGGTIGRSTIGEPLYTYVWIVP